MPRRNEAKKRKAMKRNDEMYIDKNKGSSPRKAPKPKRRSDGTEQWHAALLIWLDWAMQCPDLTEAEVEHLLYELSRALAVSLARWFERREAADAE